MNSSKIAREIEFLQTQVDGLHKHAEDPNSLRELILEACSSMLTILEESQLPCPDSVTPKNTPESILTETIRRMLLIMERSQSELGESEARYQAIVESQTEMICRFHPNGGITFANSAFIDYFAAPKETILGQNIFDFLTGWAEEKRLELIENLKITDPIFVMECTQEHINRWQMWTCQGIFNAHSELIEIQAVGHDISAQKQAESEAARRAVQLGALHKATAALLKTLNLEELLGQILDAASGAIPIAEKGMLHLIAEDTGQLEMRASMGYSDPRIKKFALPGSKGFVAKSVRLRRSLMITDLAAEPTLQYNENIPETGALRSAIVSPLISNDHVLGALSLESYLPGAFSEDDLALLASFAATATAAIHNAQLHAEVQELAVTDALTGIYNRRGFCELGSREVERSARYARPLTAIMLDIDDFKVVNDSFGHAFGDRVLREVVDICCQNVRTVDIIGRYGGDEFAILLPETDMFTAAKVADRLRDRVEALAITYIDVEASVTISLGIAKLTPETQYLEGLLARADSAMYAAKGSGKNRVVVS